MLSRRFVMAGGLAAAAAPSLMGVAHAQAGKPILVVLGNTVDASHKLWRSRSEPEFLKSDAFKKLDYTAIFPKTDELMVKEESWPADTRWILAAFLTTKEGKDLANDQPHFILAQDKKIVFIAIGNGGWRDKMLPKIAEMTGSKA